MCQFLVYRFRKKVYPTLSEMGEDFTSTNQKPRFKDIYQHEVWINLSSKQTRPKQATSDVGTWLSTDQPKKGSTEDNQ